MDTTNPFANTNPLLSELGITPEFTNAVESDIKETFSALQNGIPPSPNQNIPAHSIIKTLVEEYAKEVFDSPQQARSFITNKLLELSTCGDPRHELRALELLGKLSDIGAFSEKSEVVVTAKSSADIDRQIREKVNEILLKRGVSLEKVIDAEVVEVPKEEDELDEVIRQRKHKDDKKVETVVENDVSVDEPVEDDESA
jgi:hypothetical protein